MPQEKRVKKGRPLYLLNIIIEPVLKTKLEYALESKAGYNLPNLFDHQDTTKFPLVFTNLKIAVETLSQLSGNIFFGGYPIFIELPSYEKIRSDIKDREGHRFLVLGKTEADLPDINLEVIYSIADSFKRSIKPDITFEIARKYAV